MIGKTMLFQNSVATPFVNFGGMFRESKYPQRFDRSFMRNSFRFLTPVQVQQSCLETKMRFSPSPEVGQGTLRHNKKTTLLSLSESNPQTENFQAASSMSVIVCPDFRIGLTCLGIFLLNPIRKLRWILFLVGIVLILQTARLRYRFSATTFEVLRVGGLDSSISNDSEVIAIGPWPYSRIIDWDFWWPGFPILAYFKETQTKSSGQRHFFPILSDGKKLYSQMLLNFGESSTPKPLARQWDGLRPLDPEGFRLVRRNFSGFLKKDVRKVLVFAAQLLTNAVVRLVNTIKSFLST
jgi:hypothetical protein